MVGFHRRVDGWAGTRLAAAIIAGVVASVVGATTAVAVSLAVAVAAEQRFEASSQRELGPRGHGEGRVEASRHGDAVVAAAMIDRLVHHAEVVSLKGDSYRQKDRDLGRVPQDDAA